MRGLSRIRVRLARRLRLSLCLIALGLLLSAAWPRRPEARVRRARFLMGTVLEIDAAGADRVASEAAVAAAFDTVDRAERRLSNWRPDSELSRANRAAARASVRLSPKTFFSLRAAFRLAEETEGAFDPTVGAITEALGLMGRPPEPSRVASLRQTVGWRQVRLDPVERSLFFERPNTVIDSGAFGKGEGLDQAVAVLRRHGVWAARLNFGGQISLFGAGTPPGRRLVLDRVTVAAPDNSGREVGWFATRDGSISTSGDAEKPGHLIDPRTGQAAPFHGSVTVIADTGLRADALSTALFVMGPREGLAFAERSGIAALFVVRREKDFSMISSRAFPSLSRGSS